MSCHVVMMMNPITPTMLLIIVQKWFEIQFLILVDAKNISVEIEET